MCTQTKPALLDVCFKLSSVLTDYEISCPEHTRFTVHTHLPPKTQGDDDDDDDRKSPWIHSGIRHINTQT